MHRGLRVVDPDLAAEAWDSGADPLTERERQILGRAGEGESSLDIAEELHLSEGTVRNYLSKQSASWGCGSRRRGADRASQGLVVKGREQGTGTEKLRPFAVASYSL